MEQSRTGEESPVGSNIRKLREARHWTQEELAAAAGVDVRTIQRAEAGQPLALESKKAIAAVFDTSIERLSVSENEFAAQIDEFRKRYKIIDLQPVTRGTELSRFLNGVGALQFEKIGAFSDEQLDAIADLESEFRDWLEIGSDLSPLQRREGERSLDDYLKTLGTLKTSVSAGDEMMRLTTGDGQQHVEMQVLYVVVVAGEVPLRAWLREKNQRISFA